MAASRHHARRLDHEAKVDTNINTQNAQGVHLHNDEKLYEPFYHMVSVYLPALKVSDGLFSNNGAGGNATKFFATNFRM